MGFTNGGGFVQAQPETITAADFTSSNFSNVTHQGFDLNGATSTNINGTPGNTIQIYTAFLVGPTGGQQIRLAYTGTAAVAEFFSGVTGEVNPGAVGTTGVNTVAATEMQSPQFTNGYTTLLLAPSTGTAAGKLGGQAILATTSTTPPTGNNSVNGSLFVGSSTSDQWELFVQNTNPCVVGSTVNSPALILGDGLTPGMRMLVSSNEIITVGASGTVGTLFLNNSGNAAGSLANINFRDQSTTTVGAITPGTGGYAASGVGITGIPCPSSKTLTIWMRFLVGGNTALTAADFVAGCPQVNNVTQATVPFAASDNRCAQINGTWLNSTTQLITLFTQVTATGLGNTGDSLTVTAQFHQNSNAAGRFFNVSKIEIGYFASL